MSRIEEHLQHAEGGFQEQPLYDYLAEIEQEMSIIDSLSLVDADSSAIAHSRYFPVPRTYAGDRGCIRHVDAVPEEDLAGRDRLALLQGGDGPRARPTGDERLFWRVVLTASGTRRDITSRLFGTFVVSM